MNHPNPSSNHYRQKENRGKQTPNKQELRPAVPESYFDENEELRAELYGDEAQKWAKYMKDVNTSQIRRFYAQIIADKRKFELKNSESSNAARLAMAVLKANTAYAGARDKKNKVLADFADHNAKLVKSIKDFMAFCRHFEAIIAWHKVCNKKRGS